LKLTTDGHKARAASLQQQSYLWTYIRERLWRGLCYALGVVWTVCLAMPAPDWQAEALCSQACPSVRSFVCPSVHSYVTDILKTNEPILM